MNRWHFFFLTVFAVVLRLPYFNSPSIHIDEQFYLVVADKWVNGGLIPYVNIWDRKPIGIFAIFALAIVLFKNAILGYQLIAAAFVIATGVVTFNIGKLIKASRAVPLFAAMVYIVGVMLWEGQGGQTPVFYNLPAAIAAALLIKIIVDDASSSDAIYGRALGSSLLFGLALQIKYTCVVEASALSLYTLYIVYNRRDLTLQKIVTLAMGMALCGLLPTTVVGSIYAFNGYWREFFEANFVSIFQKGLWGLGAGEYIRRFVKTSLFGMFFLPLAAFSFGKIFLERPVSPNVAALRAIAIWIVAAFAGAVMLGNPTQHYFLPTLVPLALLTSLGFFWLGEGNGRIAHRISKIRISLAGYGGHAAILTVPVIASFVMSYTNAWERGEAADIYAVGAYMKAHKTDGCVFVFNRLPILYYLGNACSSSVYVFPNHLSEIGEVRTPGGERLRELARVLASTPSMIFVRRPHTKDIDAEAIDMLEQTLHDRYALVMERAGHGQLYQIYMPKMGENGIPMLN